jgi:hypothetical protein
MRSLYPLALVALVLGVISASPLAAQQPARASLQSRLDGRMTVADRQRIVALVDSLVARGIARGPLTSKALEGAGKRASNDQIEAAIRRLGMDLQQARAVLGSSATEPEVEAGADALRAGVSPDVLGRIQAGRGRASALLPLATLTDLVARALPADQAAQRVLTLSEQHSPDAAYRDAQQRAIIRAQPAGAEGSVPRGGPGRPGGQARPPHP